MKITVSEVIVKYLERLGVEYIFGMPGAHILPVYDCLYDSTVTSILAKHEQGAAFMAGGYARASGKIGACITTAGPGATNLVTGIANAYADKQPILVITGETPTHIFGKGGLQESSGEGGSIDLDLLFKGISRYNRIVERSDYLENVLNRASKILLSDNSGPVVLTFPFNVQKEMVDDSILDHIITDKLITGQHDDSGSLKLLTDMIEQAHHPVVVAGYGCLKANAQQQVTELSNALNIPVTSSLKAKGVISEQSPLALGSLGVTSYGPAYKYIVEQADLVIFLGAGFNERTSYVWKAELLKGKKIAQVDNNFEQLQKVFKADVAIHGDIKIVLTAILNNIKKNGAGRDHILKLMEQYKQLEHESEDSDYKSFKSRFPLVEKCFAELEKQFSEEIMVFDDNIIFAQNFFNVSAANRYYPNSGVSSLGHAIPAAIGARFSVNKPTFAIIGDGGFQMCCMEIMTAVNYDIPLTIILFNNSTMGLIRKNQYQQYEQRFLNCDFTNPDYELLARSFGMNYKRINNEADLKGLFAKLDVDNSINLIEIMIDKDLFPSYSSRR